MRSKGNVEIIALQSSLAQIKSSASVGTNSPSQPQAADEKHQQLEIYIAGRFRPLITNSIEWDGLMARSLIVPEQRNLAERIVATHPKISPDELTAGERCCRISVSHSSGSGPKILCTPGSPVATAFNALCRHVDVTPSFLVSLRRILFRGGLAMRGLGIVGSRAKRQTLTRASLSAQFYRLASIFALADAAKGLGGHRGRQMGLARCGKHIRSGHLYSHWRYAGVCKTAWPGPGWCLAVPCRKLNRV